MTENTIYSGLVSYGQSVLEKLEASSKIAQEINDRLLLDIVEKNMETQYGQDHKFSTISSVSAFKKNVAIGDYRDVSDYIEHMKNGEADQLIKGHPVLFAMTSGTVGATKAIPITENVLLNYRDYVGMLTFAVIDHSIPSGWQDGKMINLVSTKGITILPGGQPYGSLSSFISAQQTEMGSEMYTTPYEVASENSKFDFQYCTVLFALLEANVTVIRAAFMTSVYDFVDYLLKNSAIFIDDIRNGTISEHIELPKTLRDKLLERLSPNEARARELESILSCKTKEGFMKKIWPNLSVISAIGASTFAPYAEMITHWSANTPLHHCVYCASEGVFATTLDVNTDEYVLLPDTVYYEFLPVNRKSDKTLQLSELEIGKEYEVMITNIAGLYRYKMRDVIEVVKYFNELPVIRFAYRSGQVINLMGEKTNNKQVAWAFDKLADEFGFNIVDFSILPDIRDDKKRYVVFLEIDNLELRDKVLIMEERIQALLGISNKSLGVKFRIGAIDGVELYLLKPGTNTKYREFINSGDGTSGQAKPLRVINSIEREQFFRDNIL